MRKIKSQGDITFIPVEFPPPGKLRRIEDGIIARGESTGHTHAIANPQEAKLYQHENGARYLRVTVDSTPVVHQEHEPVGLELGWLLVHIDQAFDYSGQRLRNVAD